MKGVTGLLRIDKIKQKREGEGGMGRLFIVWHLCVITHFAPY